MESIVIFVIECLLIPHPGGDSRRQGPVITTLLCYCLAVSLSLGCRRACRKRPEHPTLQQFRIRFSDKNQLENHVIVVERRERGLENLSGPFWVQNSTQSQERLRLERAPCAWLSSAAESDSAIIILLALLIKQIFVE